MHPVVANLDLYLERAQAGADRVLIPRQLETVHKIRDFISAGHKEGHVVLPTGIGKTVIFSKFTEAALLGLPGKALIVGPTKIILEQNQGRLDAFADIQAGAYYTHNKDLSRQVTVTTYASLRKLVKRNVIDPSEYSLLVLDEAHRALGEETIEAVEAFEGVFKIGFTATPEFHEEKSVADLLPFRIDEMSVREAIKADLLAGLRVYVVTSGVSIEGVELSGKDFEELSLTKAVNIPERNTFIARLYKDPRFYEKRAVVYSASRDHGKALAVAFEAEGIPVAYIDGTTVDREDILAKFKTGEIKVLCNVRVLVEGFDEPEAEVCFNAAPTLSKVIAEQRGGRILRRSRVRDSKLGMIVEILDEFGHSTNAPILFSEIAGAAEILSPSIEREMERKPVERKPGTPHIKPAQKREVIEDSEIIMDLTNKNKRQRFVKMFEYAPKGWVYARKLAHELHVKESEVRNIAESKVAEHPEWFKRYLTPTDILITHYHPKLANEVRRHFVDDLRDLITPQEFAEEVNLEESRVVFMLEASDVASGKKAIRFEDEVFFSEEHLSIIRKESASIREEEEILAEEAEAIFWSDDERSDEEREADYWSVFEEITSENKGVETPEDEFSEDPLLHSEEVISFDDDIHIPLVQDEHAIPPMSDYIRKKVHKWIRFLPKQYIPSMEGLYVEGMTYAEVAKKIRFSLESVRQKEGRAIKLLRSRKYLLYMWEYSFISDDDFGNFIYIRDSEISGTPIEVRKFLTAMERKFLRVGISSFMQMLFSIGH